MAKAPAVITSSKSGKRNRRTEAVRERLAAAHEEARARRRKPESAGILIGNRAKGNVLSHVTTEGFDAGIHIGKGCEVELDNVETTGARIGGVFIE